VFLQLLYILRLSCVFKWHWWRNKRCVKFTLYTYSPTSAIRWHITTHVLWSRLAVKDDEVYVVTIRTRNIVFLNHLAVLNHWNDNLYCLCLCGTCLWWIVWYAVITPCFRTPAILIFGHPLFSDTPYFFTKIIIFSVRKYTVITVRVVNIIYLYNIQQFQTS